MATLVESATAGTVTPQMNAVADGEGIDPALLCRRIADGSVVIMQRGDRSVGIGSGLRTKVNVNLGTSNLSISPGEEVKKALIAEKFGADTLSDLSMGGDIPAIRRAIMRHTTLPITTVPIYQTAAEIGLGTMTVEEIIATIRRQAAEGVSSMVLHCVTAGVLDLLKKRRRIMGVVSKGGSITSVFMHRNRCENPFIDHIDEIIAIFAKHDIVLSVGNTARSGCIHDGWDRAHREEIRQNVEIARYAHQHGVQVIIEGAGGHIRFDRIAEQVRYYKEQSAFPLFVAGPLPTDIALGYDHSAACAGASAASAAGADYLCSITPAEHLGLPSPEHVKEGLIACKIAAHIGDTVKYGMDGQDRTMALRRAKFDKAGQIDGSFDSERARRLAAEDDRCTMCGDFCAILLMKRLLEPEE
ncbi:MAG: phosphomethylpyrimidine synthase ThiC [Methanomicrobiaceae archaeon]|nr:phosphomethylpyrimidine synthase ThiC [Methanomicrobiaceae archaeon]